MRLLVPILLLAACTRPNLRPVSAPEVSEALPATITGRVVDETGAPIADAFVTARSESRVLDRNEARTGLDGGFSLSLSADNYDFVISASGYESSTLVLRAIAADERVDLGTTVLSLTPDETDPTLVTVDIKAFADGLVRSRDVMVQVQGFDNR